MDKHQPQAGQHYPGSTGEFQSWFGTDDDCLDYLHWVRWPNGAGAKGLDRPGHLEVNPSGEELMGGGCPESRGTWVAIRSELYAAAPTVWVFEAV